MKKNKQENDKQYDKKIDEIVSDVMQNLKNIVDVNTVIGTPFQSGDGTTIIPISKIIVGFVAGGGEYQSGDKLSYPFAGGTGAGFTVMPVGFLSGSNGKYQFISTENTMYGELLKATNNILKTLLGEIKGDD